MAAKHYYIGIMSGTSLDGIDVVITDFTTHSLSIIAHSHHEYPIQIKEQIEACVNSLTFSLDLFCQLDVALAKLYALHTNELLKSNNLSSKDIIAIGCHGQTIKHNPNESNAYTLQIGDPNTLATLTGIMTVADFRRKDVALGGQGAPLTPAFHHYAFYSKGKNRAIVNIGGIANITVLPKDSSQDILGFDTGPGNTLMDHFCLENYGQTYDFNGQMAAKGKSNKNLLNFILKNEAFFNAPIPKSTGTDFFNLSWFQTFLTNFNENISTADQLASLNELTSLCIAQAINNLSLTIDEIYYCGGGSHNKTLMTNLFNNTGLKSLTTERQNIHPDWVEACAFAWFAKNTLEKKTSSLTTVTSASRNSILGGIFSP